MFQRVTNRSQLRGDNVEGGTKSVSVRNNEQPKSSVPLLSTKPPASVASMLKAANKTNNLMVSKSLKKLAGKPNLPRFGASEAEIYAYEKAHSEWLEAKAIEGNERKKKDMEKIPAGVKRAKHPAGWNSSHHRIDK